MSKDDPAKPTLRPVRFDEQGRVFYLDTGEQIIMPGLEPEAVLRGLADAKAGRYKPLKEVMDEFEKKDESGILRMLRRNLSQIPESPSTDQSDTPSPPTEP